MVEEKHVITVCLFTGIGGCVVGFLLGLIVR